MTRTVPAAAVRVLQDALAEAIEAGISDPAATAQHAASALTAHGWHVTAQPDHLTNHPTENPWTTARTASAPTASAAERTSAASPATATAPTPAPASAARTTSG